MITYKEIEYDYNLMLEEKKIPVWSYNLETILAEKFESVIKRGIAGTRIRDFYDIYMLMGTKGDSAYLAYIPYNQTTTDDGLSPTAGDVAVGFKMK